MSLPEESTQLAGRSVGYHIGNPAAAHVTSVTAGSLRYRDLPAVDSVCKRAKFPGKSFLELSQGTRVAAASVGTDLHRFRLKDIRAITKALSRHRVM